MKKLFWFITALTLWACDRVDIAVDKPSKAEDAVLFSTAVVFPEDYQWECRENEGVPSQIVMFQDTSRILTVEVSEGYGPTAEADMHRLVRQAEDVAGSRPCLFCDYSTDSETVILRNGVEAYRFRGRECVDDMILMDNDVFTLGIRRNGNGWAYRRNGQAVLEFDDGHLLSGLHLDGGDICFGYAKRLETTGSSDVFHYYSVRNGSPARIICDGDISKILSIRSHNGILNYLAASTSVPGLIWISGNKEIVIDTQGHKVRDQMLEEIGGHLVCRVQQDIGVGADGKPVWTEYYWNEDKSYVWSNGSDLAYAFCHDAPRLAYVSSEGPGKGKLFIRDGDNMRSLPENFQMISPYAISCDANMVCIGVNDIKHGYCPTIIKGRDTLRYDFNGYFTRLCLP